MTATNEGFIDLQVNGYGGVDFNQDHLTAEQLHAACERLAADGTTGILATIITEKLETMCQRLKRLVELRAADPLATKIILGFHVEGPFLNPNPGFCGAHPVDAICLADEGAARHLLDAGRGLIRLITLAPEQDPDCRVTRMLVRHGIMVSAGHSDASLDQLKAACDAGVSMFTHVGNGCPKQLLRHDNIVQRALSLYDRLWLCFIVDGHHVPFPALGNYLRAASLSRCIVVTDAIAPAGLGPGRYTLGRWEVRVDADMVARSPDGEHFLGAAITMRQSQSNLKTALGFSDEQCRTLLVDNPQRALASMVPDGQL